MFNLEKIGFFYPSSKPFNRRLKPFFKVDVDDFFLHSENVRKKIRTAAVAAVFVVSVADVVVVFLIDKLLPSIEAVSGNYFI